MSNYSVKLTKCGKCQLSLAHLPSGGGRRVADLCVGLQVPSHWGPGAGGQGGAVSTGQGGGEAPGRVEGPPGHPAGWRRRFGWDQGREGSLLPNQMVRMLNY